MGEPFYKHPLALVESEQVGDRTRVWAFAHVMEGAQVGVDCNIGEHCFVEKGAIVGNRVTIKNGVAVWDGVVCEDDVFLGPFAVLTNDRRPRSKAYHAAPSRTLIRQGATVGANATLICGITVGHHAMIGAGTVVTRDVPAHALVVGNPARQRAWVCRCAENLMFEADAAACACGLRYVLDGGEVCEK